MKQGRFSYQSGHVLRCSKCGYAAPLFSANPEENMILEERLEATHVCPKKQPGSTTRVLSGTNPQSLERAKFVLGFVN